MEGKEVIIRIPVKVPDGVDIEDIPGAINICLDIGVDYAKDIVEEPESKNDSKIKTLFAIEIGQPEIAE